MDKKESKRVCEAVQVNFIRYSMKQRAVENAAWNLADGCPSIADNAHQVYKQCMQRFKNNESCLAQDSVPKMSTTSKPAHECGPD
jgi:hypothetical protein